MRHLYLTSPHMGTGKHPEIREDVKLAQHALGHSRFGGFAPGVIDGNWGRASFAATKRAQYRVGFRHVTGVYGPDLHDILTGKRLSAEQATLARLRRLKDREPDLAGARYHVLNIAAGQIGNHESPPDSNMQKYGAWYGWNGVAWCAIFESWCMKDTFPRYRYSYCPTILADAMAGRNGLDIIGSTSVRGGDIALYCFTGSGVPEHTGLVRAPLIGGEFHAVEGNTSLTSDDNGGEVMDRLRTVNQVVNFVRVSK